ncbi:DNA replication helicase, putative [Prunus dulcis]|uniref:DNA helicase n=1 Tax=Prunus dulcis TaxID=3755 RepID=A0A4Y1QZH7_PRUDU|nr:DNA replication helicase, putative [Prunus dulcis]
MPPRKKPLSSSTTSAKKSNSKVQPQPSKFGIQHFFERHTQNSQNPKISAVSASQQNPKPLPAPASSTVAPAQSVPEIQNPAQIDTGNAVLASGSHEIRSNLLSSSNNIGVVGEEENMEDEASPEISKSKSFKRFKFSPGMSQDDGGDEVTWRISPTSPVKDGKVEKWLPSQTLNTSERSLVSLNKVGVKRVNPDQDMDSNGNVSDMTISGRASRQSPFRTPPSLSYCHDKLTNGVACNEGSDQPGLRQHKKALLELLDQVEDVISVEDSVSNDVEESPFQVKDRKGDDMHVKLHQKSSYCNFLVLEVSDCGLADSSDAHKVLRLLDEQCGEEHAVYLQDEWFYSVIAPGDTVNVIGEFDDKGQCHVDHHHNFIIVHPDVLVAGTRVAASFSCPRRTVLDERLKGNEHSSAALSGTILHQVFQAALVEETPTINFLEEHTRFVLQKNIENLYACGVNEKGMYKTLIEAVPRILKWVNLFKNTQNSEVPSVDFGSDNGMKKVKLSEVIDIEEMAWAPKYGLKGMIDASVRVKVESNKNESHEMSSMEHTAQVALYTLLMSDRYQKHIDTGLLCYLQSDQTQGVAVRRSDLVGIIMRRNELANDVLKASRTQVLPPMLKSQSMCRGCRHLNVCTIYHKAHGGSSGSSGLGDLFDSNTHHLTNAHAAFLRLWDWLIDLEAKEMQLVKNEIWRSHNSKSDYAAGCLSSVVLDWKLPYSNERTSKGDFLNAASSPTKEVDCALRCGDFVILSSESSHLPVASGIIADISHSHVSFSKLLRLPGSSPSSEASHLLQEIWRVDKDEFMTSFSVMRLNLVQLFLQSARAAHVRKMIVDLEAPRFDKGRILSQDPAISYVLSQRNLNVDQRQAILKILAAKDYALILGMPGTGKTSTMVHAVKALLIRGASILLTSYTNSAVDNLLVKLKAQIFYALEDMKLCMRKFEGIAFQSTEARENGMGVSLFCRLSEAHPQAISALQSQYRMCQGIMELSNALIYGDRLRCGSPEIANAKLDFSSSKSRSSWIQEVLNPTKPVIFINTDALPAFEAKDHKIVNNPMEAHIIVQVVEELVNSGIKEEDIGVITPYNSQAEIIRLSINHTSVEIHTIDKYQGRDKDCILVSFVRSTENPRNCSSSLLGDWHRINVALTRAKKKLIMVGSCKTLSKVLLMKLLIEKVDQQSGILNVSKKDINFKRDQKRCSQAR